MKKRFVFKATFIAAFALVLSACASQSSPPTRSAAENEDPSQITLAEAANSVSSSLVTLAATEQAAYHPINAHPSPDPITYGMGGKASIDWSGPAEPLIKQIADTVNYKLKVIGKAPAIPVIVTVNTKDQAIGDILSNVAYQCGKQADVIVYPETKVIELRYAGN